MLLRRMSLSRSRVFPGMCTKAHEGVFPNTKGVTKQAAATKLHQALCQGVLRGSGGTQHMPVMLLPLNELCTTVCCSWCGERTTAPYVTDDKSYTAIGGESSHDCVSARPANSGESRGVGRGQWEQVGGWGMGTMQQSWHRAQV